MTGVLLRRRDEDMDTHTEETRRTQGRADHLQAQERGLAGHQLCRRLDLTLLASRTVRK